MDQRWSGAGLVIWLVDPHFIHNTQFVLIRIADNSLNISDPFRETPSSLESNDVVSQRVLCTETISLFHQDDHLISRICNLRDKNNKLWKTEFRAIYQKFFLLQPAIIFVKWSVALCDPDEKEIALTHHTDLCDSYQFRMKIKYLVSNTVRVLIFLFDTCFDNSPSKMELEKVCI